MTGTEEKHKCPPHHFLIDNALIGHCKYCPAVKDFGKLQRKAEQRLTDAIKRGTERRLETVRKRGRPPKYA